MRVAMQAAFVLHYHPYRNTSLLLEVLSRDHGRFGLVARGVRTSRSRLKGLLQPFRPLLLSWSGRGELRYLVAAEEGDIPVFLPSPRLLSALYINELLLRLLHRHESHDGLYELYHQTLIALAQQPCEEPVLRIFEKHLLALLGYGLLLHSEAGSGDPVSPENRYRYILDQGPVKAGQTEAGISITGRSLLALQREIFPDNEALQEVKRLMRATIGAQLGDKSIKTRQLWPSNYGRRIVQRA